jgi:lactoylglutathione lyase
MLKLNGIGLFVNDMNTTVAFYRDVMGMTADWDGGPFASLRSRDADTALMLFGRKDFEQMTARPYGYPEGLNGTLELSFNVGEVCKVDGEYERTVAAGAVPVYPPTDEPWGQRTCYVADPDGNLIEIGAFG